MNFGLYGLHKGSSAEPGALTRRARRAEQVGFESLWVGDHVALPLDAPDSATQARLEAVVALTHMASVTTRVRLAFGVLILPQRQPVLLAKQLASLDVLSGGRVTVGVGVGYVEAELRALGSTLRERGPRTDESIAAMLALWDEPAGTFAGRFVAFEEVLSRPRPLQRPHPPIVVGGHAPASYRRAARVGAGWYGWELTPEQVAETVELLRSAMRDAGRDERLEITITPPGLPDAETVRRYAEAGAHRLVLQPRDSDGDEIDDLIEHAAENLFEQ